MYASMQFAFSVYTVEDPLIKEWFNPQPKMGLPIVVNIAKITPQIDRAQLPGTSRFCPLTISPKYHSILNQVKSIRMHHGGLSWRNQILFS